MELLNLNILVLKQELKMNGLCKIDSKTPHPISIGLAALHCLLFWMLSSQAEVRDDSAVTVIITKNSEAQGQHL